MADFPTLPFFEAPAWGNPLEFLDETYTQHKLVVKILWS